MKNKLLFIILICCWRVSYSQENKQLVVDRYRVSDYGGAFITKTTDLTERLYYDADRKMISHVSYTGKLFFDSTIYRYSKDRIIGIRKFSNFSDLKIKLTEDDTLVYTDAKLAFVYNKLTKIKTGDLNYEEDFHLFQQNTIFKEIKNSLGLIDHELSALYLPDMKSLRTRIINTKLTEKQFTSVPEPNVLLEYGVPHNAFLKSYYIYFTKDKLLVRDKFIYGHFKVLRSYQYEDDVIKQISIKVYENDKLIRGDTIFYTFKYE